MCINHRLIYNSKKRPLVVPCGHCEACRQAKANRYTSLIRSECVGDGEHITLFVTLTYSNRFIPYIKKSEVLETLPLDDSINSREANVYRHCSIRNVRVGFGNYAPKTTICDKIDTLTFPNLSGTFVDKLLGYRTRHYSSRGEIVKVHDDKVGILYFPDIQNFFKRLKSNYEYTNRKKLELSYFYTGEYGPDTLRPHFHALIRIKKEDECSVRNAIRQSWRFHDWQLLDRKSPGQSIQIAIDCAKYVSSYVNSSSYLPKAFHGSQAVPKCAHTHFYGFSRNAFSLSSLLEAFDRRDLHYNLSFDVGGSVYTYRFLYPSYVIKRYFPKIKGFSSLSSNVLHDIYKHPHRLSLYARRLDYDCRYDSKTFTDYLRYIRYCFGRNRCRFPKEIETSDRKFILVDVDPSLLVDTMSYDERLQFEKSMSDFRKHNDYLVNLHMLLSARQRFVEDYALANDGDIGIDIYEKYAQIATQIWTIRSSNAFRDTYDDYSDSDRYLYTFENGMSDNVNSSVSNIAYHTTLLNRFNTLDKSKKLVNKVNSSFMLNF